MKTLTVTDARKNLSGWLRRAGEGEEIGIIDGGQIFALRPVSVTATDYMEAEYDLSSAEAEQIATDIFLDSINTEKQGGYVSLNDIVTNAPATRKRR